MATEKSEIRETVQKLIAVCADGERGYAAASAAVRADDPLLKAELMQYSLQRRDFAADLVSELANINGKAAGRWPMLGSGPRGWMTLAQAPVRHESQSILAECERGEDSAVASYREALPTPIEHLIETQYQAVSRVHDRIRALLAAARPN